MYYGANKMSFGKKTMSLFWNALFIISNVKQGQTFNSSQPLTEHTFHVNIIVLFTSLKSDADYLIHSVAKYFFHSSR